MGISSKANQQTRALRLSEQQAFEGYLRRGRVPDVQGRELEPVGGFSLKGLGDTHPTTHYTWRTAHDERVRDAHTANEGRIFAWNEPPTGGHPGHAHNCRCWAEPYYGIPRVPDSTLALRRGFQADASGRELWASIETFVRPDGSLARSTVQMRDGASIYSIFVGSHTTNQVRLPNGQVVRVERRGGIQSVLTGNRASVPVLRSVWTSAGPRLVVPHRRVAQGPASLGVGPANEFDEIEFLQPFRLGPPPAEAALAASAGLALLTLYAAIQSRPESLGAGSDDVAAIAFRVWKGDKITGPAVVSLAALTAEQVAQSCKRLPDVQAWTNEAATELAPKRLSMTSQTWGTVMHTWIKQRIARLKESLPSAYGDISAELSLDSSAKPARYGQRASTRLDVLEEVRDGLVCVYDVKTGRGLSKPRVDDIAKLVALRHGSATFFIIEIRPFE